MATFYVVDLHCERQEEFLTQFNRLAPADSKLRFVERASVQILGSAGIFAHDVGACLSKIVEFLTHNGHWAPLYAYAETPCRRQVINAIHAGALDYFPWPIGDHELRAALVNPKGRHGELVEARHRRNLALKRVAQLTKREREVLLGMASGASNKHIGRWLGISHRTVETHRLNMLGKLEAESSARAIRVACEAGISIKSG